MADEGERGLGDGGRIVEFVPAQCDAVEACLTIAEMEMGVVHGGGVGEDVAHGLSINVAAEVHEASALGEDAASRFCKVADALPHRGVGSQLCSEEFGIAAGEVEEVTGWQGGVLEG